VGDLNFWGGCKACTSQRWAMKFCMLTDLQRHFIKAGFMRENNTNLTDGWIEINIIFMDITHESLYSEKSKGWHSKKFNGIHTCFVWIIILFDEAFKYGNCAEFWVYAGTNAEQLCVEFCNFVQRHISAK
jgi:hypothetical protein